MKAAQIDQYGNSSEIHIRNVEKPVIKPDQLLVKVSAASLNPFDHAVLSGDAQSMAPLAFPATLGLDFAGEVVELGSDVTGFSVEDRVYGTANAMFGASGAFAEYVAANATNVGVAPSTISDTDAASLPTAGISGLQAIDTFNVQAGQKVFIHGGAGGAGSVAIQIAKSKGAYVAATASTDNVEFVRSLGTDEVIDYKTQNYKELLRDYDAVFTTVREKGLNDVLGVLKKGGNAVSLVGPFDESKAAEYGVTATAQMTRVTTEILDELRDLVEAGSVRAVVDKTFALEDIRAVYASLANNSIKGKLAITI